MRLATPSPACRLVSQLVSQSVSHSRLMNECIYGHYINEETIYKCTNVTGDLLSSLHMPNTDRPDIALIG